MKHISEPRYMAVVLQTYREVDERRKDEMDHKRRTKERDATDRRGRDGDGNRIRRARREKKTETQRGGKQVRKEGSRWTPYHQTYSYILQRLARSGYTVPRAPASSQLASQPDINMQFTHRSHHRPPPPSPSDDASSTPTSPPTPQSHHYSAAARRPP